MNEIRRDESVDPDRPTLSPLQGETLIPNVAAKPSLALSKKALLTIGLMVLGVVAVLALGVYRFSASGRNTDPTKAKLAADRPAAATQKRRLDLSAPSVPATSAASAVPGNAAPPTVTRVPALIPDPEEVAEPIGVRRTGTGTLNRGGSQPASPEDSPVMLVSGRAANFPPSPAMTGPQKLTAAPETGPDADPLASTARNLQAYQRQLQGLLDNLTRSTNIASGQNAPAPTMGGASPLPLQSQAPSKISVSMLGDRSLTLPKGTAFTCALKTKVISATSGLVGCQVQRNVYGDNGRVLLIERGSHMDGEYRISSVKPGTVRIPVVWQRIRTPLGVTIDIDSPGTGSLGEAGIDGYVDNRWPERIGAAMLLSLIDDSVKLVIQNQANESNANTVVLPSTTANTSKLAEKVLDSTINIPPLIYQNQGGIVGIYVAHDVDFSSVYELKAVQR